MARPSHRRVRRALAIAPGLVLAWTVVAFVLSQLTGVGEAGAEWTVRLLRSAVIGSLVGVASAFLETGPLALWGRQYPLWIALVLRTLAYAGAVLACFAIAIVGFGWFLAGTRPSEILGNAQLVELLTSRAFFVFVCLLTLASFYISFILQLQRVLGPETIRALFLGRYRRPTEEERVFLFLDLTDSTAIAERLGPLAFTDFKNDFFADVAEPVLATGGRIVQYVGDEVMVAWPMKRALASGAPLRFFALVDAQINARAERYRQRHGEVPRFKAGCHGGSVVTAEVGDLKRDIVHSGDVVNTAARIEAECRPRGYRLLVSRTLIDKMPMPDGLTATPLGPVGLRGRASEIHICAVERAPEAETVTA